MGFSSAGFALAILLLTPNLFFFLYPPRANPPSPRPRPPAAFYWPGQIGRAGCLLLLVLSDPGGDPAQIDLFFAVAMLSLFFYLILWLRYFVKKRDYALLLRPFLFFPVPMAVLPSLFLLFYALWLAFLPLLIASVIFAFGHIACSLRQSGR